MLNQTVGYAITALAHIASLDKPILVRDVAKAVNVPGPYLAKLIHTLAKKGFVSTQRGIGGGVILAKPAKSVSLYDLCAVLDDPIVEKRCMMGTAECSDENPCASHKFWVEQRDREIEYLKNTSLADMAAFQEERRQQES